MLIAAVILIFSADLATTCLLLSRYRGRLREAGLLGSAFFKLGFAGHLAFAAVRLLALAYFIEYAGAAGLVAFGAMTSFAVVNNISVMRRMKCR